MLYWTNAPDCYDYGYVSVVARLPERDDWRLIRVHDAYRFSNYQIPRYASGLYTTVSFSEGPTSPFRPGGIALPNSQEAVLNTLGYTVYQEEEGRISVISDGFTVFEGTVMECWSWLASVAGMDR